MEVPLPRKVRVASINLYASGLSLSDDAGAAGAGAPRSGLAGLSGFGGSGAGEGLGDLEEAHTELEEGAVEEAGLVGGEVVLGLLLQHGEHVDALAGSHEVDLGLLALGRVGPELHDGGHVDGLHELHEAHSRGMVHAGVGGTDGGVEAVGGGIVGGAGLVRLLGGGASGELFVLLWRGLLRGGDWLGSWGWFWLGCRRAGLFGGGGVGVRADFAVGGELAAVGDYEWLVLFRHGGTLSL